MENKINLAYLSNCFQAWLNCETSNNEEWSVKWYAEIIKMMEALPHGSGLDSGVKFNMDISKPNRFVFTTAFHHMDEHGGYDGWTEHSLIITPDFTTGFEMRLTGKDRNSIKEYLYDLFSEVFYVDYDYRNKKESAEKKQNFTATGMVYGLCWGGGYAAYPARKLKGVSLDDIKAQAEKGMDGSLDSGMGFESLKGAYINVTISTETYVDGKPYTNEDNDEFFVGSLTESEQEFLVDNWLHNS